jgi:hypothetical protein
MVKTQFEKFEVIEIARSEIKNAPYNPRKISERARKRLSDNIKNIGNLAPIIWNARTGNIVGGHQRISVIDTLMKKKDYTLTVSKVDLDEKTEREQNIFLNSPDAQGEWDIPKLKEMFLDPNVTIENAGFNMSDLTQTLGSSNMQDIQEVHDVAKNIDGVKDLIKNLRGIGEKKNDCDFYVVVVFRNNEEREGFMINIGLQDNKYLDGKYISSFIKPSGSQSP